MSRWAVRKLHPHACGPDGTAWVAGEVGKWQNTVGSFRTYEEAMAYADQQARTIEVTLPPVVKHPSNDVPGPAWHMPGEFIRHWISTAHGKVWMTDHRGLGDLMDADVAERRGLALIAAAKHAKGELT